MAVGLCITISSNHLRGNICPARTGPLEGPNFPLEDIPLGQRHFRTAAQTARAQLMQITTNQWTDSARTQVGVRAVLTEQFAK